MGDSTKNSNKLKSIFPVTGMSCAACAVSVESTIGALNGVLKATVNYADQSVLVEYNPDEVSVAIMQKAVQAVGYDLLVEDTSVEDIEEMQRKHYLEVRGNTILSAIFSIPVFVLSMFFHGKFQYQNYFLFVISLPVLAWFGRNFFLIAWKQAMHLKTNMDTLVAISTGTAFLFSAFNTFFPEVFLKRGLHPHVYYEAATVIITFILLGRTLEEKAKGRTSQAIKELIGLQPKTVKVLRDNQEIEVPIEQVQIGEIIIIHPGERIPVDGSVFSGHSFVDESTISGEPLPAEKSPGDKLYAGTMNQKGSFQLTAEKVGADTILAHIIKTVKEAQGSKAPVQNLADKIAGIFVPVVLVVALISFAVWYFSGIEENLTYAFLSMVTVLIIACPCALGLATPTAVMVGIGKGARTGILIKDAESLETACKINAVVFDKTGTVTMGRPTVSDVIWDENIPDQDKYKEMIYKMEGLSEHPLSEAITRYFGQLGLDHISVTDFESITGKGLKAMIEGKYWLIGNERLISDYSVKTSDLLAKIAKDLKRQAKTVTYFGDESKVYSIIAINDPVKETSADAIQQLHDLDLEIYMLTGDNEETARAIAQQVNIKNFKASALPGDKAEFIRQLQKEGKKVAMAGDGINDTEALAVADLGIAMGSGSDIALEVAKVTLVKSDLRQIVKTIRLSKQTVRTIKQNLFWAFIYNVIGIPLAAGILFPFTGFLLNPMIAGAAMAMSSVSVVTNSLRLNRYKLI
jgi:P-type Cu2+ transporter